MCAGRCGLRGERVSGEMTKCEIGFLHIKPADRMTPLMYLPMQRITLPVADPCGIEQAKDALVEFFGPGWFRSRDDITDVEVWRDD